MFGDYVRVVVESNKIWGVKTCFLMLKSLKKSKVEMQSINRKECIFVIKREENIKQGGLLRRRDLLRPTPHGGLKLQGGRAAAAYRLEVEEYS